MHSLPPRRRLRIYGAAGAAALATVVALALASYQQKFTTVVTVTLRADRSGLLMDPGADVRLRGVPIGRVRSVEADGAHGARLELALDPDAARRIPATTTADIAHTTVFGPKSVLLSAAAGPISEPLRDGDVVRTRQVGTEVNDVFGDLHEVLTTVQPAKLNATLGAMARTLDGRGDRLGGYLSQLNAYLVRLNPAMGALRTDIRVGADVSTTYADVAPRFLTIARNASVVGSTLTQEQAALHALLLDVTRTAVNGEELLRRVGPPLLTAVDVLRPTTRLLAEYSPELTCVIKGLNEARKRVRYWLGNQVPGIQTISGFQLGQQGYKYPDDLPKFVSGLGPDCYELPYVGDKEIPTPRYIFDDGTKSFTAGTDTPSLGSPVQLFTALFGPFAEDLLDNLRIPGVQRR